MYSSFYELPVQFQKFVFLKNRPLRAEQLVHLLWPITWCSCIVLRKCWTIAGSLSGVRMSWPLRSSRQVLASIVIRVPNWHGRYCKFHYGVMNFSNFYCQSHVVRSISIDNAIMALPWRYLYIYWHSAVDYNKRPLLTKTLFFCFSPLRIEHGNSTSKIENDKLKEKTLYLS